MTTAFLHVNVIAMEDTNQVLANQSVVVRGRQIVALGPASLVAVPAGARRVDGRGKYLIPGLADMHAHSLGIGILLSSPDTFTKTGWQSAERQMYYYVANGVTTVRDMAGTPLQLALRARIAAGDIIGPRLYVATPMLESAEGAKMALHVDAVAKIPAAAKAAGYDLIKLYGMDGGALDTLAAEAHRIGIPIAGHVPGNNGSDPAGIARALQVGYASIEHLTGFVDGYEGGGFAFDPARLPALATSIRAAGVWSCPTLTQLAFNMGYFTEDSLKVWPETRDYHASPFSAPPATPADSIRHWMALRRQVVKALHDAGAGLLLGTDAPAGHPLVGFSIHRELAELVEAGLTPYEALATGTRNVAEYFGTLDSTGTITVGKRADLVLLAGNPLQDIHHTIRPAGVMLNGRWLSRKVIDQQLARFNALPR